MVQRGKLHEASRREARERGVRCPDCNLVGAWDPGVSSVVCKKCGQLVSRTFTPRTAMCGVRSNPHSGGVKIQERGKRKDGSMRAAVRDVYRCNKPWQCPECAAVQTATDRDTLHSCNLAWRGYLRDADGHMVRAGEVVNEAGCVVKAGRLSKRRRRPVRPALQRHVYLITLTVPHHARLRLGPMRRAVTRAFSLCHKGKQFYVMKKAFGVRWSVRRLEVTHSREYGWHPHIHAIVGTDRKLTAEQIESLREWYFARWAKHVEIAGYARPSKARGVDIIEADKGGRYLSKMGLELGGDSAKLARCRKCNDYRGCAWDGSQRCCVACGTEVNRTTWQILADLAEHRTEGDRRLWRTFVADIRNARRLTWSADKITADPEQPARTMRELYAEHVRIPEKAACPCRRKADWFEHDCDRCGNTGRYTRHRLVKRKRQEKFFTGEKPLELPIPEDVWRLLYSRDPASLAELIEAFERGDRHAIDVMMGRWAPKAALPRVTFAADDPEPPRPDDADAKTPHAGLVLSDEELAELSDARQTSDRVTRPKPNSASRSAGRAGHHGGARQLEPPRS